VVIKKVGGLERNYFVINLGEKCGGDWWEKKRKITVRVTAVAP